MPEDFFKETFRVGSQISCQQSHLRVSSRKIDCVKAHRAALRYRTSTGQEVETTFDQARALAIADGLPVRTPPSYPGRTSYPGFFWSATTDRVHVYESLLELDRLWLADFDTSIKNIAAQPFQITGHDGNVLRSHVPDILLVTAGGGVTVVDVKPAVFVEGPWVKAQFAWTRSLCEARGWNCEVFSGADGPVLRNIKFLAIGRRRDRLPAEVLARARSAVQDGMTWEEATAAWGHHPMTRPALASLIWSGEVSVDLGRKLQAHSVLHVREGALP